MGLGYSGLLEINGAVRISTGANITILHDLIESGGTYGGKMSGPDMAMGGPHIYDPWKTSSQASYELTEGIASNLKDFINNRDRTYRISIKLGPHGGTTDARQYWTGIGLEASIGSLATGSISGIIFEKTNLNGGRLDNRNAPAMGTHKVDCEDVIPYWKTGISIGDCCASWSVRVEQAISPIYCCIANNIPYTEHRDPDYIVFGPVILTVNASVVDGNISQKTNCAIKIGNTTLDFGEMELQSASDNLTTGTSFNTQEVSYRVFKWS